MCVISLLQAVDWYKNLKTDSVMDGLVPITQSGFTSPPRPISISLIYPVGPGCVKKSFDFNQSRSKSLLARTGIPSINLRLNHYTLDERTSQLVDPFSTSCPVTIIRLVAYQAQTELAAGLQQFEQKTLCSILMVLAPDQREKSIKFMDWESNEIEIILNR